MNKREIKFRVWDGQQILYVENDEYIRFFNDGSGGIHDGDNEPMVTFSDAQVMQYTGLKDKEGKDIYEGDIVIEWEDEEEKHIKQIVAFNAGAFYPVCMQPSTTFEIIGNIYEHPHLLNPAQ